MFDVRLEAVFRAVPHIATHLQILYTLPVEYPFPPVGIVGAADGKNRRAFFFSALRNDCAEVRIEDSGPGVPAEFLPHIFERFSQA